MCAILMASLLWAGMETASAQHWSDGLLPGGDWEQAILDFDSAWSDSVPAKGKGFKPFQRWRHFAEARFAFDGAEPFHSRAAWDATQWEREARAARTTAPDTLWERAVPAGLPLVGGAGRINRVIVDPLDTSRWFACAPSGGLWVSHSSGSDWTLMDTHDWAGMGVSDIALHPALSDCIIAATGDSDFGSAYGVGLMRTWDGGASWETTGLTFSTSATMTCSRVHRKAGAPEQWLAATSDGLWISEDDGETFIRTAEGIFSDLLPHPGDSSIWHAAKRPGELFRSEDGGRHWIPVPDMPSPFLVSRYTLATSESNPAFVAAIAAKGGTQGLQGIYLSNDSGNTFFAIEDVPNLLGWTVDGADFGGQGFYDLAFAIDPLDPDHLVAGGVNLWESWNGGQEWHCTGHWFGGEQAAAVHADHHAVTFIPGSSHWVSAHDGGVSRRTDNGFLDLSNGLEVGQVYRLGWSESQPDLLLTGWQDNGVNLLSEGTHAQVLGADGFQCLIDPATPEWLFASEYYGKASRSNDGGWSWEPWIGSGGEGVDEQGDWNTPMSYSLATPGRIFVAKHRLYWTDNQGDNWSSTAALPGSELEVLALAASDDSTAFVARGAFGFITEDLASWTPMTGLPGLPILDAVIHAGDAQSITLAFGGYDPANRVWTTSDGGTSWSTLGVGLPALPVNAIVEDEVTGDFYAGTDAGVYVLPATGDQWTPYKAGLPEVICSDLGIRRSTGEILLATYGRGLWKAPLFTLPERDAAIVALNTGSEGQCAGPVDVRATIRNAGSDTLVSATLIWNDQDTMSYGFILPPGEMREVEWIGATRGAVDQGDPFHVRLIAAVGLSGTLQDGALEGGVDAVAENDMLGTAWPHREGAGQVVMKTVADCMPMESAWAIVDSSGTTVARHQHFGLEEATWDTLCLTTGCHEIWLHDAGGNGFAGPLCGMEGELVLMTLAGDTLWSVTDGNAAGIGFPSGWGGQCCLPQTGISGCTDQSACNFNPGAAEEDGSCFWDCLEGGACPADMDGDGLHGASDILAVLAQFGCMSGCSADVTGDDTVSANDILALLALYGEACEE